VSRFENEAKSVSRFENEAKSVCCLVVICLAKVDFVVCN
jgi:hypothetical protein